MTTGGGSNRGPIEIPSARTGLNAFLAEIAAEFGIPDYFDRDQGDFPARVHGYIGGNSVRAFSYFAQNFLRALSPEQGAFLLKNYGLHIPQEEKDKVAKYLKQINYVPYQGSAIEANSVQSTQPIDPQVLAQFIPGSPLSGAQIESGQQQQNGQSPQGPSLH